MRKKFNFSFDEWSILNQILSRPDKEKLLESLDALLESLAKSGNEADKELQPVVQTLKDKVEVMSIETLRDVFSMLPVDPSLGISLYR